MFLVFETLFGVVQIFTKQINVMLFCKYLHAPKIPFLFYSNRSYFLMTRGILIFILGAIGFPGSYFFSAVGFKIEKKTREFFSLLLAQHGPSPSVRPISFSFPRQPKRATSFSFL